MLNAQVEHHRSDMTITNILQNQKVCSFKADSSALKKQSHIKDAKAAQKRDKSLQ